MCIRDSQGTLEIIADGDNAQVKIPHAQGCDELFIGACLLYTSHADPFGQKPIKTVKLSDAKGWFVFLHDSGIKQNTICLLYTSRCV